MNRRVKIIIITSLLLSSASVFANWGCTPEPPEIPSRQIQPHHDSVQVDHFNMESINAVLIHQGLTAPERLSQLNAIAISQMRSLVGIATIKQLGRMPER